MSWDDPDERVENVLQCAVCERIEELELPKCPACKKRFCEFCVFRIGGHEYCGRECGIRFFFASDDEDEMGEE
jgi:hypothetical protein